MKFATEIRVCERFQEEVTKMINASNNLKEQYQEVMDQKSKLEHELAELRGNWRKPNKKKKKPCQRT